MIIDYTNSIFIKFISQYDEKWNKDVLINLEIQNNQEKLQISKYIQKIADRSLKQINREYKKYGDQYEDMWDYEQLSDLVIKNINTFLNKKYKTINKIYAFIYEPDHTNIYIH